MNFEDEPYVRVYKRRTTTMAVVGWQARAILRELFLIVDRAGVLDLDDENPSDAVAALLGDVPVEIVADSLARLEKKGCIQINGSTLVIPKFRDAQETPSSDKLRARESRDRRRADAMKQPKDRTGFIYFIQPEAGGPIKIGFASDVASRMCNIQTSRHDRIVLLASAPGTPAIESDLHDRFSGSAIGGEWFSPSDELIELISVTARDGVIPARDKSSHPVTTRHVVSLSTIQNNTIQNIDAAANDSPSESPKAPEQPEALPSRGKRSRLVQPKFEMGLTWEPSSERVNAIAVKHGIAADAVRRQIPEFRLYWAQGGKGYHPNKPKRHCDWETTFSNRIDQLVDWGKLDGCAVSMPPTESQTKLKLLDQADQF